MLENIYHEGTPYQVPTEKKKSQEAVNLVNVHLRSLRPELLRGMKKVKTLLLTTFNSG